MKCPNCGEVLSVVEDVCPFCKATIGQEPKAESHAAPADGEELVTLTRCGTLVEADAIRAQLEASGIKCFLPDEALMQTIAWNVNTYGYIRIQIASKDYEAAKELLSVMKQNTAETATESGPERAQIPLSWPMKFFAFVMPLLTCPGLILFAVAKSGYTTRGYERKAKELWEWFAGGIFFWLIGYVAFAIILGLMAR